jgi:hypothetical protein
MTKIRRPLQVSDKFLEKLKELQRKIRMKTGDDKSLRELTENIVETDVFEELEKQIIQGNVTDIKLKMDKRNF